MPRSLRALVASCCGLLSLIVMPATAQIQVHARDRAVSGARLHYLEAGASGAPTVILLHGARYSAQTWLDVGTIARLAERGHHVIALDLPGYGQSEVNGISRDRYLAGALDSLLPGEKVVIVSPSMSGNFSLPFVARHADRVAGFVPVAPVGIETYLSELRRVQVPTLAVWGELDMVVPVAQADLLVSALKGRKLILAGASHACYLDRPDDFHAALLKFLSDPAVVGR